MLFAFALPLAAPARAYPTQECDVGPLGVGAAEVTSGSASSTFYVDDRDPVFGTGIWVYQESNGEWRTKDAGVYGAALGQDVLIDLQRGNSSPFVPNDTEICTDCCEPDQLVF